MTKDIPAKVLYVHLGLNDVAFIIFGGKKYINLDYLKSQ